MVEASSEALRFWAQRVGHVAPTLLEIHAASSRYAELAKRKNNPASKQ